MQPSTEFEVKVGEKEPSFLFKIGIFIVVPIYEEPIEDTYHTGMYLYHSSDVWL